MVQYTKPKWLNIPNQIVPTQPAGTSRFDVASFRHNAHRHRAIDCPLQAVRYQHSLTPFRKGFWSKRHSRRLGLPGIVAMISM